MTFSNALISQIVVTIWAKIEKILTSNDVHCMFGQSTKYSSNAVKAPQMNN